MESEVARLAREFKDAVVAGSDDVITELVKRWLGVEQALEGEILALIEAYVESGEVFPSDSALFRDERFLALMAQVQGEINRFARATDPIVERSQFDTANQGLVDAGSLIGVADVTFSRLPVEAVQNIVSIARAGKPLGDLLQARYPLTAQAVATQLINGVALGYNPRKTARLIVQNGLSQGLNHTLLVARDQQLRAYKQASLQAYRASGVVRGYHRLAAKNRRTCLSCLQDDGNFYPLDEDMPQHPQCRCTRVPALIDAPPPVWTTGREWFDVQPEATQRKMMGNRRFEAWQKKKFTFDDLTKIHQNPTWGASNQVTPLRELLS